MPCISVTTTGAKPGSPWEGRKIWVGDRQHAEERLGEILDTRDPQDDPTDITVTGVGWTVTQDFVTLRSYRYLKLNLLD